MIRRPPRSTPLYSSAASDVYKRQRVHDALRRAEMGGMMPPEEPPAVPAEVVQVNPDLRPPEGGVNGAAAAAPVGPMRLNIHPGMLHEVQVVPFSPAPESHLLD